MNTVEDHPTYRELLMTEEPHPIKTASEAAVIQQRIDEFVARGKLSEDEEEYLALLGALILGWEEGQYRAPDLSVHEILRSLLEDNGLRQIDLVGQVFATRGIVSEVLAGKRGLTYDHVKRLADFFHVSPAMFYPSNS
jgi:HTH-type transcriptional regulator/antitoxin HigA